MSQAGVIDGLQFARGALEQRGALGMEQLPRLAQMQCTTGGLDYVLRGSISGHGEPCLRVSVTGGVQVVCQRCLGMLSVPIEVDTELQFAGNLREIAEADDDIDRVLASKAMGVAELVEDEVLLALPAVPRHEACAPVAVTAQGNSSPFGKLAALRRVEKR
jgi:uncharacterized protein